MQSSVTSGKRLKLGEILVNAGILSPENLEKALDLQQEADLAQRSSDFRL